MLPGALATAKMLPASTGPQGHPSIARRRCVAEPTLRNPLAGTKLVMTLAGWVDARLNSAAEMPSSRVPGRLQLTSQRWADNVPGTKGTLFTKGSVSLALIVQ
jgi:hypothetical protein